MKVIEETGQVATTRFQFQDDLTHCQSPTEPHKMQMCILEANLALTLAESNFPKACFREPIFYEIGSRAVPVIKPAVDENGCGKMTTVPTGMQGTFSTPMIVDIQHLFTGDDEKRWEINGKSIKCCVSAKGVSTQLVNMNANWLPSYGKFGRWFNPTGCGHMYGYGFHDGLGGNGESSCPVSISKIMSTADINYEDLGKLVNLTIFGGSALTWSLTAPFAEGACRHRACRHVRACRHGSTC
jgi:hypothetical protein